MEFTAHSGAQQFEVVRLGRGSSEQVDVGADVVELYAVRDQLNAKSLRDGKLLGERRYAVRPLFEGKED